MLTPIRSRLIWIDIARGIAILAIIGFHTGFLPFSQYLVPLCNSWMIAVFPISAGYLNHSYTPNLHTLYIKPAKIILLYFCISFMSLFIWLIIRQWYPHHLLFIPIDKEIRQIFLGYNLIFNGPLWFLPCYFLSLLFFTIIYPYWKIFSKIVQIMCIGIIAGFSFLLADRHQIFSYDLAFLFLSFMLSGNLLSTLKPQKIHITTIILLGSLFVYGALINGIIDMNERIFHYPVLFWLNALSGSLLIFFISNYISKRKSFIKTFLSYIGKHSLLFFSLHWPLMQINTTILAQNRIIGSVVKNYTHVSFLLNLTRTYQFIGFQTIFYSGYMVITISVISGIQHLLQYINHHIYRRIISLP